MTGEAVPLEADRSDESVLFDPYRDLSAEGRCVWEEKQARLIATGTDPAKAAALASMAMFVVRDSAEQRGSWWPATNIVAQTGAPHEGPPPVPHDVDEHGPLMDERGNLTDEGQDVHATAMSCAWSENGDAFAVNEAWGVVEQMEAERRRRQAPRASGPPPRLVLGTRPVVRNGRARERRRAPARTRSTRAGPPGREDDSDPAPYRVARPARALRRGVDAFRCDDEARALALLAGEIGCAWWRLAEADNRGAAPVLRGLRGSNGE